MRIGIRNRQRLRRAVRRVIANERIKALSDTINFKVDEFALSLSRQFQIQVEVIDKKIEPNKIQFELGIETDVDHVTTSELQRFDETVKSEIDKLFGASDVRIKIKGNRDDYHAIEVEITANG